MASHGTPAPTVVTRVDWSSCYQWLQWSSFWIRRSPDSSVQNLDCPNLSKHGLILLGKIMIDHGIFKHTVCKHTHVWIWLDFQRLPLDTVPWIPLMLQDLRPRHFLSRWHLSNQSCAEESLMDHMDRLQMYADVTSRRLALNHNPVYIGIWQCVRTLYPWWTSK